MVVLLLALTTSVSSLPQQAPDMQQGSDPWERSAGTSLSLCHVTLWHERPKGSKGSHYTEGLVGQCVPRHKLSAHTITSVPNT